MEKVGIYKRDILVDRVEEARDAQVDAKEEFSSALEQFQSVVDIEPSDLKKKFESFNREYNAAKNSAEEVSDRIDAIENVAEDLFEEWEEELEEYSNNRLKRRSEAQLANTRRQYNDLISSMRRAESKMDPVLTVLNDQVLFLKHNLNAEAVGSLEGELTTIENDVGVLVEEMEKAIAESEAFIRSLEKA